MVIHFPDLFVIRIVVLLEPGVPSLPTCFDAQLDTRVDIDTPLALDQTSFLRVDCSSYLDYFTCLRLRSECFSEIFRPFEWILIGLVDRRTLALHGVLGHLCLFSLRLGESLRLLYG